MLIVADENISFVQAAFGHLGEVRVMPGRAMTADAVRDAELLLVRSVTRVDEALLAGSRVRFVGTATIGTDHVDVEALRRAGIAFAAAPGSNADSVAEYVTAALLVAAGRKGWSLAERRIGVVGVGNVGSRVAAGAEALGMQTLLNDPPLQRKTGDRKFLPLEALFDCDVITLHVPLEAGGPDPTHHLADAAFLARMRPDAVFVNTSRGAVADNAALLDALSRGRPAEAVLDVWEGEPRISVELLERVLLGTPHIAGYSLDGKVNGTAMLYAAACDFLGVAPKWNMAEAMPLPEVPEITLDPRGRRVEDVLREAVLSVYPIEHDDRALRATAGLPREERAAAFDRLRKEYPARREFRHTTIHLAGGNNGETETVAARLRGVGFRVASSAGGG